MIFKYDKKCLIYTKRSIFIQSAKEIVIFKEIIWEKMVQKLII